MTVSPGAYRSRSVVKRDRKLALSGIERGTERADRDHRLTGEPYRRDLEVRDVRGREARLERGRPADDGLAQATLGGEEQVVVRAAGRQVAAVVARRADRSDRRWHSWLNGTHTRPRDRRSLEARHERPDLRWPRDARIDLQPGRSTLRIGRREDDRVVVVGGRGNAEAEGAIRPGRQGLCAPRDPVDPVLVLVDDLLGDEVVDLAGPHADGHELGDLPPSPALRRPPAPFGSTESSTFRAPGLLEPLDGDLVERTGHRDATRLDRALAVQPDAGREDDGGSRTSLISPSSAWVGWTDGPDQSSPTRGGRPRRRGGDAGRGRS